MFWQSSYYIRNETANIYEIYEIILFGSNAMQTELLWFSSSMVFYTLLFDFAIVFMTSDPLEISPLVDTQNMI